MTDKYIELRTEQLEKLIPQLVERVEKKSGRRILIAYLVMSVLAAVGLWKLSSDLLLTFLCSWVIGGIFMFIIYIISSLTFCKNVQEKLIIEKLITELAVLNGEHEDLSTEIYRI